MNRSFLKTLGLIVGALIIAASSSLATVAVMADMRINENNNIMITADDYKLLQSYKRQAEIADIVHKEYWQDVEDKTLTDGAARGMLAALSDAYTFYYTPEDKAALDQRIEGKYAGVGLQLAVDPNDNLITVMRVFRDSPGEALGILPGDKVIRVFDTDVTGEDMDKAVAMMKGEAGTDARITTLRGTTPTEHNFKRAVITINRVEYRMAGEGIGLLTIYEFMGDDVTGFNSAIADMTKQGMKALIIDVRDNPGGFVTDVVGIADALEPEGIIVYSENRYGEREEERSDKAMLGLPLVVLVNEHSASASEILAGSVQDHGVGTIVGMKTFGKGIMQTVHTFRSDGAGMQLTTAQYFTPKGRVVHKVGITPDVVVDLPEDVKLGKARLTPENDTQLKKAIEILAPQIK